MPIPRRLVEQILTPSIREFEAQLDRSIQTNFQVGGRPKWAASKHRTGAALQKSRTLANSIIVKSYVTGKGKYNMLIRTNNVPYARIQQFGGVIRPVRAKALPVPLTDKARKLGSPRNWPKDALFPVKTDTSYTLCEAKNKGKKNEWVIAHYILLKSVKIPGRPYIVVQAEDVKVFSQIVRRNMKALG